MQQHAAYLCAVPKSKLDDGVDQGVTRRHRDDWARHHAIESARLKRNIVKADNVGCEGKVDVDVVSSAHGQQGWVQDSVLHGRVLV